MKRIPAVLLLILCIMLSACSLSKNAADENGLSTTISSQTDSSTPANQSSDVSESSSKQIVEASQASTENKKSGTNILVVYFSRVGISESFEGVDAISSASLPEGNTIVIANMIAKATGGNTFQIITDKIYPAGYRDTTDLAAKEQDAKERPALKSHVANWGDYDTIFLGYPNWWGTCPMAVFAFMEEYDFSGKTVIPFCTHEGSGLGSSETDIASECPNATLMDGLAIRGSNVNNAQDNVEKWLTKLGY